MLGRHAIDAVVFDLDGVLVDSEGLFDRTIGRLAADCGGRWDQDAQQATMGMGSAAASAYMHEVLGFRPSAAEVEAELDRRIVASYREHLPAVPGAAGAVRRLAADGLRLGLASSSNRCLIEVVLDALGLTACFEATVSAQEVAEGKPAPDVYLEAARRLGLAPGRCAAVEDSANGIRSARAAGLRILVLPHAVYPLAPEATALADTVLGSLDELSPELVRGLAHV
jgi:HAD superfamily hydrolase (TIGR01509 family)